MLSAICFNLDQSKILLSGNGKIQLSIDTLRWIYTKEIFQYQKTSYDNLLEIWTPKELGHHHKS